MAPLHVATRARALAFAALVFANVLLAFGPWLVRLADVGPLASGFWRLALALPVLLVLTRIVRQPIPRVSRPILIALLLGGLFFAADLAAWHSGILHTRLANATLFGNMSSFLFAGYGFFLARRLPRIDETGALLLAALGAAMLLGRSYELSPQNLAGDLLCLLAGFFYTLYFIAMERARATMASLPVIAVSTAAGIAPLLIFAWIAGDALLPHDWTPLILLALGSQVIGQGLLVFVIGELPPLIVGLGLLLQPVVGAMIGWLAYRERLGLLDLLGAAMIGAALVLVKRRG